MAAMEQFKAGLIENGLIEGQNSTIDYSFCRGPPPKLTPDQRREAITRRDAGKETLMDIARSYNVSHSTINRL